MTDIAQPQKIAPRRAHGGPQRDSWRDVGSIAAEIAGRLRRRVGILARDYPTRAPIERLVAHLHRCGPRPMSHFLDELAAEHGIATEIVKKLGEYRRLDPRMLQALRADQFARAPLRRVSR